MKVLIILLFSFHCVFATGKFYKHSVFYALARNTLNPKTVNYYFGSAQNVSTPLLHKVGSIEYDTVKNNCKPGFRQKGDKCVCMDKEVSDVIQCTENGTVYILKGKWSFLGAEDGLLQTRPCLPGHCQCKKLVGEYLCVLDLENQCANNYMGNICSECPATYSTMMFSSKCEKCSDSWLGMVVLYLFAILALTWFVVKFHISAFSGYCNAFFYYYQLTYLYVPSNIELWPAVSFVVGFFSLTGRGGVAGICFSQNIDKMGILILNMFIPLILVLSTLLIIYNPIPWLNTRPRDSNVADRRSNGVPLSTILVIIFGKMILALVDFLRPVEIKGKLYVYEAAYVEYFKEARSIVFGVIALLFLVIMLVFLILITFTPSFNCRLVRLLEPTFDALKQCFNTRRDFIGVGDREEIEHDSFFLRMFAAYYFYARIVLYIIHSFILEQVVLRLLSLSIASTVILVVFLYFQPYRKRWYNIWDTTVLAVLSVQGWLSLALSIPFVISPRNEGILRVLLNLLVFYPLVLLVLRVAWHAFKRFRGINNNNGTQGQVMEDIPTRAQRNLNNDVRA